MEDKQIKETNKYFYQITEHLDAEQIDMLIKELTSYNNTASQQTKIRSKKLFEKFGNEITVTCPTHENFGNVSLSDFFHQIVEADENGDHEKDVIEKFNEFVVEDAGPDELQIAFNAFIWALKRCNWLDEKGITEDCSLRFTKDKVLFETTYSELKNDDIYKLYTVL